MTILRPVLRIVMMAIVVILVAIIVLIASPASINLVHVGSHACLFAHNGLSLSLQCGPS